MAGTAAPPRVMIGTPAYGAMVHLEYVRALFGFSASGIAIEMAGLGNESLITRARNTILAQFHRTPACTHLLFLDADVHLPAEGLRRMLAARVPVIGAPVAVKGLDDEGNRIWNISRGLGGRGRLIAVEHVGTAALLLSREAVSALVEDAIAEGRVYRRPVVPGRTSDQVEYDVFQVGVQDGHYLSEDFWACQRLRRLGFEILIDPSVITTHHGMLEI